MEKKASVPWFLWPFWAVYRLVLFIIGLTGRVVAAVLGLVLMVAGVLLTITVVGAVIGVPLIIFGFMLTVRSIF